MSSTSPLRDLSARPGLVDYVRFIWERRDFLAVVPRLDVRASNANNRLGQFWGLLNPIFMTAVYFIVFGLILGVDRGIDSFIAFLAIGVLMFQLPQRTAQAAATAISSNEGLIRSTQFPRALLPLSVAIKNMIEFRPAIGVILFVALADTQSISLRWLLFPIPVIAAFLVSVGLGLITARIGAFVQDLKELLPHAFRILLYFSGVLFEVDRLVDNETVKTLLRLNPIFDFIALARWCLIGTPISTMAVVSLAFWTVALPVGGLIFFHRQEVRYGA